MADLFTLEELASRVQSDLDTATATLARAGATALVESYCRTSFTATAETTLVLRVRDGRVRLPHRPVTAVSSVSTIGDDGAPLAVLAGWTFDGIDTVRVDGIAGIINLAEDALTSGTVSVTFTYGYATVPADVKEVALSVAHRMYTNPAGMRQESVGAYSVTIGTNEVGTTLYSAEKLVLDRYRKTTGTVRTGGGRW